MSFRAEREIFRTLFLARSGSSNRSRIKMGKIFDDIIESIRFGPDWTENIKIERKISERDDIYGSKTEIRQIFWNIILNALQSMPDGLQLPEKAGFRLGRHPPDSDPGRWIGHGFGLDVSAHRCYHDAQIL